MTKSNVVVALALSLLLLSLTACKPDNRDNSEGTEKPTEGLTEPIVEPDKDNKKSDVVQKLQEPPTAHEVTQPDKRVAEQLFDEFEFSTVDESVQQQQETQPKQPYCIGKSGVSSLPIAQACKQISKRLASVTQELCESAQLVPSQCLSADQFPILYREFAPLEGKTPKGRILLIGGTHGDELTSVSIVFKWIEKLNKFHSGLFHWHVVPMMNPDGVLKRPASRMNSNGVDLNRNLPSHDWQSNALKYWKDKTDSNPRRYPGENAASEPETQWLIDEIKSFKPDAIISVHAPYGVVDFDAQILNTAPKSLGRLRLNLLGTYPGSLGNYAGINQNIPVITLELPNAWEMPSKAETTKIWEDIVSWLRKNINREESESSNL